MHRFIKSMTYFGVAFNHIFSITTMSIYFLNNSNTFMPRSSVYEAYRKFKKRGKATKEIMTAPNELSPHVPTVYKIQPLPGYLQIIIIFNVSCSLLKKSYPQAYWSLSTQVTGNNFLILIRFTDSQSGVLPKNDDSRAKSVLAASSPKQDEALVMFSLKFHSVLQTKQASCQSVGPKSLKQSTNLSEKSNWEVIKSASFLYF